ncbi:uncharacterized protein BKA78DRAFT_317755 [Phyllosticta capitalensis]|uniref:uncharacterized protein n=1 Tax=Phyllosticta capitalensis TaxID=121624 RepID=UPI00312DDA7A
MRLCRNLETADPENHGAAGGTWARADQVRRWAEETMKKHSLKMHQTGTRKVVEECWLTCS